MQNMTKNSLIALLCSSMMAATAWPQDIEWLKDAEQIEADAEGAARQHLDAAKELLEAAGVPSQEERDQAADWLQEAERELGRRHGEAAKQGARDTIDSIAENRIGAENYLERAKAAVEKGKAGQKLDPDVEPMFALITLGMGDSTIINLLREAEQMETPVIFVVRGFDPDDGGLQGLVEQVLDINEFEIEFQMHVNPTMFRQVEAERAPVFIREVESGAVKIRRGAVNLHAALESMDDDSIDLKIGETYEIEEPDLLDVIEQRIKQVDGEKLMAEARERSKKRLLKAPENLPVAQETGSYLVDPTITLRSDIATPDGHVIAPAGTVVNPLEHAPWTRQYVFFDATVDWQVDQAEQWSNEAGVMTTFIANRLPNDEAKRKALGQRLNAHVHLLNALIIRRMDLRAVPSRAQQDGMMVRVDTAREGDQT